MRGQEEWCLWNKIAPPSSSTVEAAAQCADRWISYPQRTPAATDSGGETQSLAMGHSFSLLWPLAHQE